MAKKAHSEQTGSPCVESVFAECVSAARRGQLIERESEKDKEFHFQNWFRARLDAAGHCHDPGGRNSYPDFHMVASTEGFELKGLAYPGRWASFDSNSQVPCGFHNGRTIYYVFGRYPKKPDGNSFPLLDLVVCHGDFLNVPSDYTHKNKSARGFGCYGDILIRDRKMYVVRTPFHIATGLAHRRTLILPSDHALGAAFFEVGRLDRVEASHIVVGYAFDLVTNELKVEKLPNPNAGKVHKFCAWRVKDEPDEVVVINNSVGDLPEEEEEIGGTPDE